MKGFVVASQNGNVGIEAVVEILRQGGPAIDAVVAGLSRVEANPEDLSVGYAGLPNLLGEVELDASVMIGQGLRAGSVGALKNHQDAARLAKIVMDELPHVLIVGDGAERLARSNGLKEIDLLTDRSRHVWQTRMDRSLLDGTHENYFERVRAIVAEIAEDPELATDPPHGTVNFIARDRDGRIASGVSTSGWAWKYPGRVGDSPIIGAGNYADDRWGAATCTGRGEMAQRALTAHTVVMLLRFGHSLQDAVKTALTDLNDLDDPYASEVNIIAIDRDGNHFGASTAPGKTYITMYEDDTTYTVLPRDQVQVSFS